MTLLRRIRGVVGTAVTWALAWVIVVAPLALFGYWGDRPLWFFDLPATVIARLLLFLAGWGALHGALFATLLTTASALGVNVLTLRRLMAAGVIAGMAVPVCSAAAWWWWAFLPVDLPLSLVVTGLSAGLGGALASVTYEFVPRTPRPAKGMVTDDTGCTDLTENNKRATRSWLV
jgi:hypothetical protein